MSLYISGMRFYFCAAFSATSCTRLDSLTGELVIAWASFFRFCGIECGIRSKAINESRDMKAKHAIRIMF